MGARAAVTRPGWSVDRSADRGYDAGVSDAAPAAGAPTAWVPTYPRIRRLDALWYQGERALCAAMFLVMALLVFASVVAETFTTRRRWIDVAVLFAVCLLATWTRAVKDGERPRSAPVAVGVAAVATAALAGAVYLYTEALPGGVIWAQKLTLHMMLWVSLLGASIATYERSHLALEMGEKLWPAQALRFVKAAAHGVTSAFCLVCAVLAVHLIGKQQEEGLLVEANRWLSVWQSFLIMPYAFAAMAVRFLAQAVTTVTGAEAPAEDRLPT